MGQIIIQQEFHHASPKDVKTLIKNVFFFVIGIEAIGASSGSTGGGIKTSTFGVIFAFLKSKITARNSVNLFYRTLPNDLIMRAFSRQKSFGRYEYLEENVMIG